MHAPCSSYIFWPDRKYCRWNCSNIWTNIFTFSYNPAGNYMFKVNNRNTRTRSEICPKLTIKTHSTPCSSVSNVNFEQVNVGWERECCIGLSFVCCFIVTSENLIWPVFFYFSVHGDPQRNKIYLQRCKNTSGRLLLYIFDRVPNTPLHCIHINEKSCAYYYTFWSSQILFKAKISISA